MFRWKLSQRKSSVGEPPDDEPLDVKPDWLVESLKRVYEKSRSLQEKRVRFKGFDWEGTSIEDAEMNGLVKIFDRVYVFDCCFSTTVLEKDEYRNYLLGNVRRLRESFRKGKASSFMLVDFHRGNGRSKACDILSGHAVKLMDFPTEYGGCPLLPLETINRFLRSSMAWLFMEGEWGDNNVLLLHCERGGWPVLAFMLAVLLLLYRKLYTRERKTLEMAYDMAPRRLLLAFSSPLNPQPSHLRYLQYVSRRDSGSDWSPMDKPFNLECLLLRLVPNFDGEGGCRPMVRVYGREPSIPHASEGPKVLFSTPKTRQHIQLCRQEESTIVKLNVCCRVQGDVVIECVHLDKDLKHEEMMFRFMFNTAFVRSNSLLLGRKEIDVKWNAKDRFHKDFKVEILTAPLRDNGDGRLGLAVEERGYRSDYLFTGNDIDSNSAGKVFADRLASGSSEYKASMAYLSFGDPPSQSTRVFHSALSNPMESIAKAANRLDEFDKTLAPRTQHSSSADLEDALIQFEKDLERANSIVKSNISQLISAPQGSKEAKNPQQSFSGDEPLSTAKVCAIQNQTDLNDGHNNKVGKKVQKSELNNKAISDYQESTSREARGLIVDNSVGEIDLSNMLMDYRELMILEELGTGGFGTVHHGTWRGIDVAIKRTKKSNIVDQQSGQDRLILESLREAGILSKLQHPNVVSLYGCVLDESSSTLAIVTELVGGGSLSNILHREDKYLDYCKRLTIAKGAASGMEYLHLKNIVHFDLKCDNLLVDLKDPSRPICKVIDFGLSKIKKKTLVSGSFRGTLPWMAPELFKRGNNKVSEKVDVYSFGIVMWEIITGEVPYNGMHEAEILGGMYDNTLRPPVPASCDPEWRELMEQCWTADPQQRPSFAQIASRLHWMLVASS